MKTEHPQNPYAGDLGMVYVVLLTQTVIIVTENMHSSRQIKLIFFLFLHEDKCCWYSSEVPQ